jgi:hypothetical protein
MLAMNRTALLILGATVIGVLGIGACASGPTDAAVATPSVTVSQPSVRAGRSVDVLYRFQVSPGATISEEHLVFVHAYDRRGIRLWTADHRPSPPTTAWARGSVVEYTQPMTVPHGAPAGRVDIVIGLYSPRTGERLPLGGSGGRSRAYPAASLDVTSPPPAPPPVFVEGWHAAESPEVGVTWRWSKGTAQIWFRNPSHDAVLALDLDQPITSLTAPQRVEIGIAGTTIDRFELEPGASQARRIRLAAGQFGTDALTRVTIAVTPTFVPAALPAPPNGDMRELGVRLLASYLDVD